MNRLQHPAFLAFSATTIWLFLLVAALATPTHDDMYHMSESISVLAVPILLNFAAVWLILTLVLLWARRNNWVRRIVYPALAIGLPWMIVKDGFAILGNGRPVPAWVGLAYLVVVLAVGLCLAVAARRAPHIFEKARKAGMALFALLIFGSALQVGQAMLFCWEARNENAPRPLHHSASSPVKHPRIVWVVLDELSYQQVYERRYPSLQLPEFDRLAAGSAVFTHAVPAGSFTQIVLPSLMTGIPMDQLNPDPAGAPLHLHDSSTGKWLTLDPHDTVFQDALNAGYSTGVAGWYVPYCRFLPEVLDHCSWRYEWPMRGGMDSTASIWWNTREPMRRHIGSLLRALHLKGYAPPLTGDLLQHQSDYRQVFAAADRLLQDTSANFVLLHMPIPHPSGIYRRDTAAFATSPTSYIDNLALTDIYLAHLREMLDETGGWDNTTIVLMGDHSWRSWKWIPETGFTPEEMAATQGGTFDERPAYIVKLAGQTAPLRIDTPFDALRTRSLFDALFAGQITTPQQLADWAAHNGTADKH